jgi:DNA-binding NarL/FixJ family response regulator
MRAGPARVLVAGIDQRMRERVREAIAALPDAHLVGEVESGEQAIMGAKDLQPDVLVLDMEVPGVHAIGVTRTVLSQHPQVGIVVWIALSEGWDLPYEKASWIQHAGACCCVDDKADQTEVEQALMSAARGERFLSSHLRQRAALSLREHHMLSLLAAGWTDAHIAGTLKITRSTVRRHIVRISQKLGIGGRDEAVIRGRELGFGRDSEELTAIGTFNSVAYYKRREEFYKALNMYQQMH